MANRATLPRNSIDGQEYGVDYRLAQADRMRTYQNRWNFISILLWSKLEVPNKPTWWNHVEPIFRQYPALYPVMKGIIDLADYDDVVANRDRVKAAFEVSEDDARYMPVTRDLSPAKRQLVLSWLETKGNSGRPNLGTPPAVAAAPMEAPAAVAQEEARADPGGKTMALERLKKRSEGQTS